MATQLESIVGADGLVQVGRRAFKFLDFKSLDDVVLAGAEAKRTTYTAMLLPKSRVVGLPDAEVWSVMRSNGAEVVRFAVSKQTIINLM